MSLAVWLPLNGDLHNLGLNKININSTAFSVNNSGKIGLCIKTSTSAGIDLGFNGNWINTGSISFGGWFKFIQSEIASAINGKTYTSSATSATGNLIGNNSYGGISLLWNSNNMYSSGSFSSISVLSYLRTSTNGARATTAFTLPFNTWTHIFLTYNKNDNLLGLWINGELKYTCTQVAFTDARSYNLFINLSSIAGGNGPSAYIPFYCNDIRIYDHCLSKKEIKKISQCLILHYELNFGNSNLLSHYVTPGQGAPGITTTGGRTNYYGNYGVIIPATENADTYFRLFLKLLLILGETYTISCYVSGLKQGTYYRFPLFALGNTSMGVLSLDHNGLCSLTFTMNSSTQTSIAAPDGTTLYICFMDDSSSRAIASGLGPITLTSFKLEKGNSATNFYSNSTTIYDSSGFNNNGTIINNLNSNFLSPNYKCSTNFISSSYIRVNNKPSICLSKDAITISLWANTTTWGNPISCTEGGGWNFENGSSGIRFPVYISGVGYKYQDTTTTVASLNNSWHMITGTMDKDNIKVYIDGELKSTVATGSSNGIGYANNYLFINAEAAGDTTSPASAGRVGALSDVRIYATALSADDIKELYRTSKIVSGTTVSSRSLE